MRLDPGTMHGTLSWVLASVRAPDWALADLLATDLDPECHGAVDLVTSSRTKLATLLAAKSLFKTLRIEGETIDDRRIGSILYAATIGAALVHFDERITRQRTDTLRAALLRIEQDDMLPDSLRALARTASPKLRAAE